MFSYYSTREVGPNLPEAMYGGVLVTLSNNEVLIMGGSTKHSPYTPTAKVWKLLDDLTGWQHMPELSLPAAISHFDAIPYKV